jgi:hypothetical protein
MTRNLNQELGQGKKFIIAADHLVEHPGVKKMVILSDFRYWTDHYDELEIWAGSNQAQVVGMTVEFCKEQDLVNFILRWS